MRMNFESDLNASETQECVPESLASWVLITLFVTGCSLDVGNKAASTAKTTTGGGTSVTTPTVAHAPTGGGIVSGSQNWTKTAQGYSSIGSVGIPVQKIMGQTQHGYKFFLTEQGKSFSSSVR